MLTVCSVTKKIRFALRKKAVVGVVNGVGRKFKRSDSSDSDSVALMTPLTTPICDFYSVIGALTTTPLTTPTRSLVKSALTVLGAFRWGISLDKTIKKTTGALSI